MSQEASSFFRIVTALALFIGLLFAMLLVKSSAPFGKAQAETGFSVTQLIRSQPVQYQDRYQYKRDYIGQVEAKQTAQAAFELSGTLSSVLVDEGQFVRQGTLLATLNNDRLNAIKQEAEAILAQAESDAQLAEITYQRIIKIREANAVSAQVQDEAVEARDTTAAAVAVAKARLNTALVEISKSQLTSPFDGTVTRRLADQGDVVSPGQPILQIQQATNLQVRVGVTHQIADQLSLGEAKSVQINGHSVEAAVIAILPLRAASQTIDILLEITSDTALTKIRTGDVAKLSFSYPIQQRGFWVPITALSEGNRGLWSLFIPEEATLLPTDTEAFTNSDTGSLYQVAQRTVEIHHFGDGQAFVSGAVRVGERFVLQGASKLVPGQLVSETTQ